MLTGCVGEIGLTGEIRSVPRLGRRLAELNRQGFHRWLVRRQAEAQTAAKIEAIPVGNLAEAFDGAFPARKA